MEYKFTHILLSQEKEQYYVIPKKDDWGSHVAFAYPYQPTCIHEYIFLLALTSDFRDNQ